MSSHYYCQYNCGGTDCTSPERTDYAVIISSDGRVIETTLKESAIEEIKEQPYYKAIRGNNE